MQGLDVFQRRWNIPVYATEGSLRDVALRGDDQLINTIVASKPITLGEVVINPIEVPHDASEPTQFVIECQGSSLGILTDTGHVPDYVADEYRRCNAIFVEANHDRTMLRDGPYPAFLKERIASEWGHLSNEQTRDFLDQVIHSGLHRVVVGHISERNNKLAIVEECLGSLRSLFEISYATQEEGTGWVTVAA